MFQLPVFRILSKSISPTESKYLIQQQYKFLGFTWWEDYDDWAFWEPHYAHDYLLTLKKVQELLKQTILDQKLEDTQKKYDKEKWKVDTKISYSTNDNDMDYLKFKIEQLKNIKNI